MTRFMLAIVAVMAVACEPAQGPGGGGPGDRPAQDTGCPALPEDTGSGTCTPEAVAYFNEAVVNCENPPQQYQGTEVEVYATGVVVLQVRGIGLVSMTADCIVTEVRG